MTTTTPTKSLAEMVRYAKRSMSEEPGSFEETHKALEECGEVLIETLNALYSLWNLTMLSMEPGDLVLAVKVTADTGARLRTSAIARGLVECYEDSQVLKPGAQIYSACNAVSHLQELFAAQEVDS